MLQTSITTWLRKPKAVTQPAHPPDAVPLKTRQPKHDGQHSKDTSDSTAANNEASAPPPAPPLPSSSTSPPAHPAASPQPGGGGSSSSINGNPVPASAAGLPALAPNVALAPLTAETLPSFRRLNTLLLEVPYPPKFYDEILSDPVTASITLAAFWNNNTNNNDDDDDNATRPSNTTTTSKPNPKPILVAGVRCRLLSASALSLPPSQQLAPPAPNAPPPPVLYIATLSTLSPYRSHGLASHLLSAITAQAARQHGVAAVFAHVWEANEDGLAWYRRRGFEVLRREEGYYRKLRPAGAWVVWRRVGVRDLLAARSGDEVEEGNGGAGGRERGRS